MKTQEFLGSAFASIEAFVGITYITLQSAYRWPACICP